MNRDNELSVVKKWEEMTGLAFLGDIDDPDHFWIIYDEVMEKLYGVK